MGTHDLRLRLAQIAAQNGRSQEAAHLYAQVLVSDPCQVEAWYGLSQVIDDRDRVAYCLRRVVDISPGYLDVDNYRPIAIANPTPNCTETAASSITENWPLAEH